MAKQMKEKKGRRARTIIIVIEVIIVLAIIGSAVGCNKDENNSETEAMTETVTEAETVVADAVVKEETEAVAAEEITEEVTEVEEITEEMEADDALALNHIASYDYEGTEEDPDDPSKIIMFWNVYFDEDANTDNYMKEQYKDIIISCLQQPESKENAADEFGIQGFDSENNLEFSWLSYVDKYTITKYIWSSSEVDPDTVDWTLSDSDYNDIISAKTEGDNDNEYDTEIVDAEKESESEKPYEWDAGGLAYLGMSRDELLAIYNDYDKFISEETADMSAEETQVYEDESAEQVASEYGITADDVNQIFMYGSEPNYFATFDVDDVEVPYGEVRNVAVNGADVSLEVKISSLASNEQTIEQNYYNVCDFIRKYAKTDYDVISYDAFTDTAEGDETNAVSFDLSGDIITTIATQDFPDNTLGDYVENLYILPSLQE